MRELYEAVAGEVEKVVVGQEQMTATALAAISLGGHVLLEGPRASPRRCWPRRSRARSGWSSGACSSRPTCCPRT
jgi:hypothetical protein